MSSLNATKKKWRKTKGLEMDDIDVARTLKELQQEMLQDEEVIHHLTRIT